MNKFLISLFLFLLLIPTTLATPTVTVVRPNGGELFSGTETITWTVSSSENSQDLNALVYYSLAAGGVQDVLIDDVNLLSACNFTTRPTFWDANADFNKNMNKFHSAPVGENLGNGTFFKDSIGKLHFLLPSHTAAKVRSISNFTWNEATNNWDINSDANVGLDSFDPDIAGRISKFESFEKDGDILLIVVQRVLAANNKVHGYKWNVNQWEYFPDINAGLPVSTGSTFSIINRTMAGRDWWLLDLTVAPHESFYYDDTTNEWIQYDYLIDIGTAFGTAVLSIELFEYQEKLHAAIGHSTIQNITYARFDDGSWTGLPDFNNGIFINSSQPNISFLPKAISGKSSDFLLGYGQITNKSYMYQMLLEGFATNETADCSLEWDTITADNGSSYYIDVNAIDQANHLTGIDTSDSKFTILNWTIDDIDVVCIKNCTFEGLDANGLNFSVDDDDKLVEFKVINDAGSKTAKFNFVNSLDSTKQYFIYTGGDGTNYSFNDTITFGTTTRDGIQKIWTFQSESTAYYVHSFFDTVASNETKYYKMQFRQPMKSWRSVLDHADWDVSFAPQLNDLNGHLYDQYTASSYSNIRNELIEEIPNIGGSFANNANYVFQVNAKTDSGTGTLYGGSVSPKGTNPTSSGTVDASEERYTFSSLDDGILSIVTKETTSRIYTLSDYALMQRGFFTRKFKILDPYDNPLEVYADDLNNVKPYLIEGQKFRVTGQLYDRSDTIDFVEISAYLEVNNDSNRVAYYKFDVDNADIEKFIYFAYELDGVIDLSSDTLDYQDLLIKVKVTDSDANYSEVQSDWIKLRQFPFTPKDLSLRVDLINTNKGDHPSATINLKSIAPETIRGIQFRFASSTTGLPDSDYNAVLYKDQDFTCIAGDCSFRITFDDWVIPKFDLWRFVTSVLLTTQEEDLNNTRTTSIIVFYARFKEFKIAKIIETRERDNNAYLPTERIPLTLVLQDSDGSNLQNKMMVYITVEDCVSSGGDAGVEDATACTPQDLNYAPKSFLYDDYGTNYWFFESILVKENFTVFNDSNFLRVVGHVVDIKGQHVETDFNPLLTSKCDVKQTDCTLDLVCFIADALLSIINFGHGCTTEQSAIVAFSQNGERERRLDWDSSATPTSPSLECVLCVNADQNNVYFENLEQDITCTGIYKLGQQSIDKMSFFITNNNSDLSETDPELKQYINLEIPYSMLYYNDPILLKMGLEAKNSFGTCADINSIGELFWCGLNDVITPIANPISDFGEFMNKKGIILNTGFDCNFWRPIDPNYLTGMFRVTTKGIKITNMRDYYDQHEFISSSDSTRFFRTLRELEIERPHEETEMLFYGNEGEVFFRTMVSSDLVINKEYDELSIRTENISDVEQAPQFKTMPSKVNFKFVTDLVYNDERSFTRRVVPMFITTTIRPAFIGSEALQRAISIGIWNFFEDPIGVPLTFLGTTILSPVWWANEGGWFWIFLAMLTVSLYLLYRGIKVKKE